MRPKAIALSIPVAALLLTAMSASSAFATTAHRASTRHRQHANASGLPGLPDFGVAISAPPTAAAGDTVQVTVTTFETTGTAGTGTGTLTVQVLGDTTLGTDIAGSGGLSNCNGGGPFVICQYDQSSPSGNVTFSVTINSAGPTGQVAISAQLVPVPPLDGDPSNNIANATITVGASPTPTPTPSTSPTDTSTPPPDTSVPPTSDITPVGGIQTGAGGTASSFPVVPVALAGAACALTAAAWLLRRRRVRA